MNGNKFCGDVLQKNISACSRKSLEGFLWDALAVLHDAERDDDRLKKEESVSPRNPFKIANDRGYRVILLREHIRNIMEDSSPLFEGWGKDGGS